MRPAERITLISIALTTLLGAVEVGLWFSFGLLLFLAAGLDALFDTFTSLCVLWGLRLSRKPADRNHQYGHGQAEFLASLLLAGALVAAAVRVLTLALRGGTPGEPSPWLFAVAGVALLSFSLLGYRKLRVGRTWHHPSVVADAYHTLTDALSSLLALLGLAFVRMGAPWMDALVASLISLLILCWGLRVGKEAVDGLMGSAPLSFSSRARRACLGVSGVRSYHRCRARRVGSRIQADLHIQVDPSLSVREAHEVASRVERRMKSEIPELSSVVVHVEPSGGKRRR